MKVASRTHKISLPANARVYRSPSLADKGSLLIFGSVTLYSPDGQTFLQIYDLIYNRCGGGMSPDGPFHFSFKCRNEGRCDRTHHVWIHGDKAIIDGEKIGRRSKPSDRPSDNFIEFDDRMYKLNAIAEKHQLGSAVVNKTRVDILQIGDDLILGGTALQLFRCPAEVTYDGLPANTHEPIHLFRVPYGCLVYLDADRYSRSIDSFRLYLGTGDEMSLTEAQEVRRTDSGFCIGTAIGDLTLTTKFIPKPFALVEKEATWLLKNGELPGERLIPLQILRLADFVVTYTNDSVCIKPKSRLSRLVPRWNRVCMK
jgi:hypothetical protein